VGIGNLLVSQPDQKLGTMTMRTGSLNFVLNPQTITYTKPVAILVDGLSGSTSEILAQGLRDLGRAQVFGTPTAGAALPSTITDLPNGDGFQYAFANYTSYGGDVLEGRGVQPDQIVRPSRDELLSGRDNVLDAAVQWIQSQPAKK
jgi:carboxyl-terminal processing protease